MSAWKKLRRLGGDDANLKDPVAVPPNPQQMLVAIDQLQRTIDELVTKYNAHTHTENTAGAYVQNASTAAPAAGQQVSGAVVTPITVAATPAQ